MRWASWRRPADGGTFETVVMLHWGHSHTHTHTHLCTVCGGLMFPSSGGAYTRRPPAVCCHCAISGRIDQLSTWLLFSFFLFSYYQNWSTVSSWPLGADNVIIKRLILQFGLWELEKWINLSGRLFVLRNNWGAQQHSAWDAVVNKIS